MKHLQIRGPGVASRRVLFQSLDFAIREGDRIDLIVGKGLGKTTLLHCLAHLILPGSGNVTLSRSVRIGDEKLMERDGPEG